MCHQQLKVSTGKIVLSYFCPFCYAPSRITVEYAGESLISRYTDRFDCPTETWHVDSKGLTNVLSLLVAGLFLMRQ
jgi:hypothetical protein